MIDYLKRRKDEIAPFLEGYLLRDSEAIFAGQRFGNDVARRLLEFTCRGKMIRGALVYLGAELYGHDDSDPALVRLAAVMELLQSFLLIHDDIMDRDRLRRGGPSIYAQFDEMGEREGIADHLHFGESMGICAGDVAIFLATGLISHDEIASEYRQPLLAAVSQEIARVGLAQMGDVFHGVSTGPVTEEDVINVYRFKTGRYTFSLPLICGAILAGADERDRESLGLVGEGLGVVFQIKDDEIGLFGSSDGIGKTVGSDISEDKKTLHRISLFESVGDGEREELAKLFGARELSGGQVTRVLAKMREYEIDALVRGRMQRYAEETVDLIAERLSHLPQGKQALLKRLLDYNLTREA